MGACINTHCCLHTLILNARFAKRPTSLCGCSVPMEPVQTRNSCIIVFGRCTLTTGATFTTALAMINLLCEASARMICAPATIPTSYILYALYCLVVSSWHLGSSLIIRSRLDDGSSCLIAAASGGACNDRRHRPRYQEWTLLQLIFHKDGAAFCSLH